MIKTDRKPVELFIEQLNIAYERNLILSLSYNYPHVAVTFHKETEAHIVDRIVDVARKNYQSIQKIRVECHRHHSSRHYHYSIYLVLDK
jgi:hypothetical protein